MKLEIKNTSIEAELYQVIDIISEKEVRLVVNVTETIDEIPTKTQLVYPVVYQDTWTDEQMIAIATEEVNKRYK